jgi:hypothetical protein
MAKRSRRIYTDAEVERALVAIALHDGNTRRAARVLKEQGLPIPRETLRAWPDKHEQLYSQVQAKVLPLVKAQTAEEHMELARYQMQVSRKLTERLDREANAVPIRDVSTAQRNLDVGSGIHTQRGAELRGEPQVVEYRNVDVIGNMRRLREKHPGLFVDSTADEIEPPKLERGRDE